MDYDFSTLNDREFEILVNDILSKVYDTRIERFKSGRDGGVDGRFFTSENEEIIIQCKHYLKSGYSQLKSTLNEESKKVKKLNPKKYIFATSLPLSRLNKQEIKKIFSPYIKLESDIYGQEDLNDLLKNYPEIEKNHYKLWLSSTNVLQIILNNGIKGRSKYLLKEIEDKIKIYVETSNHVKALETLEELHTVIITGEPGIGKTTLAENLSLFYTSRNYEFVVIENSLNEAEAVFEEDKKQIFYFDDFLGSNYLLALEKHSDSHITSFINRIKRDKNKRFILTSRTNIFNQSLFLSDTLKNRKIDKNEFLLKIEELSDFDKAKILYNHIYFSNLDEKFINEIYFDKRYINIMKHKNFNPRIIEYITDSDRLDGIPSKKYWDYVENTLNNPSDIWNNTFNVQSDEFIRCLVILTVFNSNKIEEELLRDSYNKYIKLQKIKNSSHISKEFEEVVKTAVRYFLNRNSIDNKIEYSLFNPSIADFIIKKYKNEFDILVKTIQSLETLSSIEVLSRLLSNKFIDGKFFNKLLVEIFKQIDISNLNYNYQNDFFIKISFLIYENSLLEKIDNSKIVNFFDGLMEGKRDFSLIIKVINLTIYLYLFENESLNKSINDIFLEKVIELSGNYLVEINAIIKLFNYFDINNEDIVLKLIDKIRNYLLITLEEVISSSIFNDDIDTKFIRNCFYKKSCIKLKIENSLKYLINEIEFNSYIDNAIGNTRITIDMNELNEMFYRRLKFEEYEETEAYKAEVMYERYYEYDDIEDLFDRG